MLRLQARGRETLVRDQTVTEELDDRAMKEVSLAYRYWHEGIRIDGDIFEPGRVPYLLELYDATNKATVIRKGAQLGLTSWAILTVIDRMLQGVYPRGVIYCFPTEDEVFDFSQSRFNRMLRDNVKQLGSVISTTDRAMLKQIGEGFLYFRGMRVSFKDRRPTKLLSIPADCLVMDEYDDMDPKAVDTVMRRLDSSKIGHWVKLGHPSIPEYGIDLEYRNSDQRRWMIPCHHCREYTCLEAEFPDCFGKTKDGEVFRACRKCGKEIIVNHGEWVALHPGREVHGYWVSQLLSATKPPGAVLKEYENCMKTGRGIGAFHNMVMGMAYADLDQSIDADTILSLCDEKVLSAKVHEGGTFGGADVGAKNIHACFGVHEADGIETYLCFPELETFDELYDLSRALHCQCLVIDVMAEARAVGDYLGRDSSAWGCRYVEGPYVLPKWDSRTRVVTVGRTQTLDESHHAMVNKKVRFHRRSSNLEDHVVPQLTNLVRIITEDQLSGQRKPRWVVRGPKNDHWRHAFNYSQIASAQVGLTKKALRHRDQGSISGRTGGWEAV